MSAERREAVLEAMSPEEREAIQQEVEREEKLSESLLDYIPRITPKWQRPVHLAPVARLFERSRRGERVRALVSAPPRNGKTELVLHAIPYYLEARPDRTVGYVSYGAQFAEGKSRLARDYARNAGFNFHPEFNTVGEWRNDQFGGCVATGIGGPLTGKGLDLLVVDDPHKDRVEAESPLLRDRVEEWFRGTGLTRLEPDASVIVFQQRWHPDDLFGRCENAVDEGWEIINLPALYDPATGEPADDGVPLWPQRWTREALQKLRIEVGEYNWWSQYFGKPRPRGGKVFQRDPARYIEPSLDGARIVLSVDGAGTESTRSDFTAAVALAVIGYGSELRGDVLEVWQDQLVPERAAPELLAFQRRHGGAPLRIENTRDGKAIASALKKIEPDLVIELITPIGDKFIRAQPAAAAWNQGRIRVPMHAPWVPKFLAQADKFTGVGSKKDDMIDALSQGWNVALGLAQPAEDPPDPDVSSRWSDNGDSRAW
jgi:predicted phage terminase large subunit-like protein